MKKTKKKKKIYEINGNKFDAKSVYDLYNEIQKAQEKKLIESFELPQSTKKKDTKNKFGAAKCQINGHVFDSIMEARFYVYLLSKKKSKKIQKLELQPKFVLQEKFEKDGKKIRPITYWADFLVAYDDNNQVVYDVKGRETPVFKLKKKMFNHKYRDLTLSCVRYTVKKGWFDIDKEESL